MSDQENVHKVILQCLEVWTGKEECPSDGCLHPEALVVQVESNGNYTSQAGKDFRFSSFSLEFHVAKVQVATVGNQSLAAALVTNRHYCGWVVLLNFGQWQCISATFSPPAVSRTPQDHQDVIHVAWDGYCRANRACDGQKMATVFHELCRLTEATDAPQSKDGGTSMTRTLFLKSQPEFCQLVANRYNDPTNRHYPFRYLRDDLPVVSRYDSLDSVEFATDRVALVTLKVGHPPCLWTDFLTMAKLSSQWWIVHKSSCADTFPV